MEKPDAAFRRLRGEIIVQHEQLRSQLGRLDADATQAIRADPQVSCDLPGAIDVLVRALSRHMEFEEHGISADPVAKDLGGAGFALTMHEEHGRQHEELIRLMREAVASDDRISLSLAIRGFVDDLLLDMKLEERRLFLVSP